MPWPPSDAADVISFLKDVRTEYSSGGRGNVLPPWELRPQDYMMYARLDVRQRGPRGLVNALSNAKRALHCQVDSILYCSGLWELAAHKHWRFPKRLEMVGEMQIATAGVLRRINKHRNDVEHEYTVPKDRDWLEDLIDSVELFIGGTERFASSRYDAEFVRPFRTVERVLEVTYSGHDVMIRPLGARAFYVGPRDAVRADITAAFYAALVRTRGSL